MKYIFEKGCGMPLCGYDDQNYFKFEDGEIIESKSVIEFIKNGLKRKTMSIKEVELEIYKLTKSNSTVGYIYVIDQAPNYLNIFKQPLTRTERMNVINKVMQGQYKKELRWGVSDG